MHISPLRKNIPLTVVTLAALGIMLFLFFMHPSTPEESLEFYTPDGNGVGSFRVEITDMPSNPAYTEVKIDLSAGRLRRGRAGLYRLLVLHRLL